MVDVTQVEFLKGDLQFVIPLLYLWSSSFFILAGFGFQLNVNDRTNTHLDDYFPETTKMFLS